MVQSEIRNPQELEAAPWNPGEHPQEQLDQIGDSFDQFDQFKNVVIWQNKVIAGKGVWQTAIQKGLTELEVKDYSHLTEEQAKMLCLADRALPAGGFTSPEVLQQVLDELGDVSQIPGVTEAWLAQFSLNADVQDIEFQEYDESIADDVEVCVCPTCGHEHTKK